jgi:phosphoribosyl-ATP pyrophosphohydrolase/phosphoribosyl-AMP cyclohydrolase
MSAISIKFDNQGLVPAILQDRITGDIRMFAFASAAAVRKTLETGYATYWSRSRGELWQKGRAGGRETPVVRVLADCDADCLVYSSDPQGPSCHSGAPSCFFHSLDGEQLVQASGQPQTVLASLEASLTSARTGVGGAASDGRQRDIEGKLQASAKALGQAMAKESDDRVVSEAADLLYELMAAVESRSIGVRRVLSEIARRLEGDSPVLPPG